MSSKKNQGWVAWHPTEGFRHNTLASTEDDSRFLLCGLLRPGRVMWLTADSDGWRIRPVKLVFLDGEGE